MAFTDEFDCICVSMRAGNSMISVDADMTNLNNGCLIGDHYDLDTMMYSPPSVMTLLE